MASLGWGPGGGAGILCCQCGAVSPRPTREKVGVDFTAALKASANFCEQMWDKKKQQIKKRPPFSLTVVAGAFLGEGGRCCLLSEPERVRGPCRLVQRSRRAAPIGGVCLFFVVSETRLGAPCRRQVCGKQVGVHGGLGAQRMAGSVSGAPRAASAPGTPGRAVELSGRWPSLPSARLRVLSGCRELLRTALPGAPRPAVASHSPLCGQMFRVNSCVTRILQTAP